MKSKQRQRSFYKNPANSTNAHFIADAMFNHVYIVVVPMRFGVTARNAFTGYSDTFIKTRSVGVVYIHNCMAGELRSEEFRFCLEVALHISMKIKMILGQICKTNDIKLRSVDAMLGNAMATDFHRNILHMSLCHCRSDHLKGGCFWGRK